MLETASIAFATFFATIGPLSVTAMFAALTARYSPQKRFSIATRATLVASAILITFAIIGEALLAGLGISLGALRTAGGVLLLLIGMEMVFARDSGATSTTSDEAAEAQTKSDIAVFPLATPLIAGPGAIGSVILLMADAKGGLEGKAVTFACLLLVLLLTFLSLLAASKLQRLLGITGIQVISRVLGILLTALAVQFIFDGIKQSGFFVPMLSPP